MGIVISGMTADARFLTNFMRKECMNYWYAHGSHHPAERLVAKIANKSQHKTCMPGKRPFGVGLLVGSVDEAGTHLFETCPSGNYYEYHAIAIGDRNQSAKTYLEKNYQGFKNLGAEDLIKHGIRAMKASCQDIDVTEHNISVAVVGSGKGHEFKHLTKAQIRAYLAEAGAPAGDGGEQMIVN